MSTEETADKIIEVVTEAVTAAGPVIAAADPVIAPEALLIVTALRAILSWAKQLGHGDVVREALDAELAAGRQADDAALAAKVYPP